MISNKCKIAVANCKINNLEKSLSFSIKNNGIYKFLPARDINKLNYFNLFSYGKNVLQGESNKIIIIFDNVMLVYLRLYNFRIILNRSTQVYFYY